MKRTLFVSYSHNMIDRDKLNYLIDLVEKKGRSTVKVLMDLKEVKLGASIADYMALIESYDVDAVLMVLTPSYKNKVERNEGKVSHEFRAVYARYQEDKERVYSVLNSDLELYEDFREFGLLPIILHGNSADSVPESLRLEEVRYWDISSAVVHKDREQKVIALGPALKQLEELADIIVVELKNIAKHKDKDYQERRSKIRAALFANTKAGTHSNLESEVFVHTTTYQRVVSQESHFIVGRKGSGKSTLAEQLELQNPQRYATHVRIDFSDTSLAFVYSFYTDKQFQSDSGSSRGYRAEFFELVWEYFFALCLMWHMREVDPFLSSLNRLLDQDVTDSSASEFLNFALCHSIEKYQVFQNQTIDESTNSLASLPARLSNRYFLEFALGQTLLQTVTAIVAERTVLVTLDGMDSGFNDHRFETLHSGGSPESIEYFKNRARVEVDLIKALMRLISKVKAKAKNYPVLSSCHYCITIPLDLYQEIKGHHERDSYQWMISCRSLDWSGHELALMLRKRIEKLTLCVVDKNKFYGPKERLLEILDECYPGLPKV